MMKFKLLLLFTVFIFINYGCEKENLQLENQQLSEFDFNGLDASKRKSDKVLVCHYSDDDGTWHLINVNGNAWKAHAEHGDVRLDDQDGDGFVPDNECGYGDMGDCDDLDSGINPDAEDTPCDGIDQDCNGEDAEFEFQDWYHLEDEDQDGWYVYFPENNVFATCPPTDNHYPFEIAVTFYFDDCNDIDADVHPGAIDECGDQVDANCNGDLIFDINSYVTVGGSTLEASSADFGPLSANETAEWEYADPSLACGPISNDLSGKIALVDRGACFFSTKGINVEFNGAVAVIICNLEGLPPVNLGLPVGGSAPGIPTVMLSYEDCQEILLSGETEISLTVENCFEGARLQPALTRTNLNTVVNNKESGKLQTQQSNTFE